MVYTDDDGNVSLLQATAGYETEVKMMRQWMDNGWVYPDSGLTDVHGDELLKQGVAFSSIQESEHGVDVVKSNACGYEVICAKYYDGMIRTSTLSTWGIAVPITSEEPEAAVRVINLLYTDAELMNLLIWGVEGTDYELVGGEVVQPESGYYYEADFLLGNNMLLHPLQGNGSDFYDEVKKIIDAAAISPYLGFALNTTDLDLVISQLSAVREQYRAPMQCGSYTPELYAEYLTKLEAAGVQEYLDAVQTQLSAWLAAQ